MQIELTEETKKEIKEFSKTLGGADEEELAQFMLKLGGIFLEYFLDGHKVYVSESEDAELTEVAFEMEAQCEEDLIELDEE